MNAAEIVAHFAVANRTGDHSRIGLEIETDFVDSTGRAMPAAITDELIKLTSDRKLGCDVKLELGRQKLEIAVEPSDSFTALYDTTRQCLDRLYTLAATHGCVPVFGPELHDDERLLYVTNERDRRFLEQDGEEALEHLADARRCNSRSTFLWAELSSGLTPYGVHVSTKSIMRLITDAGERTSRPHVLNTRKLGMLVPKDS